MLRDAYDVEDGPVALRWPKTPAPSVPAGEVGIGLRGRKVIDGERVCLIGVGKMLGAALEAAEKLEAHGVSATVWDPRVVKPLDPVMLDDAGRHDLVITVEDGLAEGGIGSNIAMRLSSSDATVKVLGVPTEYLPHDSADVILSRLGLDGAGVATAVLAELGS